MKKIVGELTLYEAGEICEKYERRCMDCPLYTIGCAPTTSIILLDREIEIEDEEIEVEE